MDHTANLLQAVIQRLDGEPLDELVLEDVDDRAIRKARSTGATILALANLEATGHVLPFGESRVHQWDGMTIPYNFGGVDAGYRTGDQFNYSIAAV
jgi:hypothetical protein